ncbi:hypothetical protein H0H81_002541, partial [Sphagnurus paluster]
MQLKGESGKVEQASEQPAREAPMVTVPKVPKPSKIPTPQPPNYCLLNNSASCGPQEWRHHVPDPNPDTTANIVEDIPDLAFLSNVHSEPNTVEEALTDETGSASWPLIYSHMPTW